MRHRTSILTLALATSAISAVWFWPAPTPPSDAPPVLICTTSPAMAPSAAPAAPEHARSEPAALLPVAPGPRLLPPAPIAKDYAEYWALQRPILDLLPHLKPDDVQKLGHFCPADFNKDNTIDQADVQLFLETFANESSPIFRWCDLDEDGVVDDADTDLFLRLFTEGGCDPEAIQSYRSMIC